MKIAFLLTCYNRKEFTVRCLKKLWELSEKRPEHQYHTIVCDDNSTDGTVEEIEKRLPDVEVILTTGNNYWCKGMYIAMQKAFEQKYQLYFMINDDVEFFDSMLDIMLHSYESVSMNGLCGIVGTTISHLDGRITYGGRKGEFDLTFVAPQIDMQICGVANWNCFVIPHEVIERIGLIDGKYAHSFGDFDYSMRMGRADIPIYVAEDYVGYCERNGIEGTFQDTSLKRIERLKRLYGKKGIPLYSSMRYYKKNFGFRYCFLTLYHHCKAVKDIILGK